MKNKKNIFWNLLIASCSVLALWAMGAVLIHFQTVSTNKTEDEINLAGTLNRIDMIFDTVTNSLDKASHFYNGHCDEMVTSLRQLASLSPYSRSFSIVENNVIRCSSLEGDISVAVSEYFKEKQKLSLSYGPIPTNNTLVINLKRAFQQMEIIASIPGFYFYNDITGRSSSEHLYLNINGFYLNNQGQLRAQLPVQPGTRTLVQASSRYDYKLTYVLPDSYTLKQYYQSAATLFYVFIAFGPLAGIWLYNFLNRPKSLRRKLEMAIYNGEIQPWFQPQVDTSTGELIGCEVLARWISPNDGIIPPNQFIPLAEESGLVVPMTRDLMQQVKTWLLAEQHKILPNFHVSVNFSSSHILSNEIVEDCRTFLTGIPAGLIRLVVEITESEVLNDHKQINDILTQLHDLGAIIAIDDFGTGYSNLSYLQDYPLDILKVDRKFIAQLEPEIAQRHLIAGIIDISKKLELRTVVEGVETEKHVESLKMLGATWLQGFYYGKPVSASEFTRTWLNKTST
ncbi:cyclic diguanylate phosphodiesterase [Enterobacteriaceae bacterium 4M9]|nr:cyclic diguanylate phosphodiesterase [Enterobacteriaceae bacterium 4M9]